MSGPPREGPHKAGGVPLLIAIRLRGTSGWPPEVEKTLSSLRLRAKYNAVILPKRPEVIGMLHKVKDVVTWGEATEEALTMLISRRGRLKGNLQVSDEVIKNKLKLESIAELARSLLDGSLALNKLYAMGFKQTFRLHPPKGGFKGSIKRPYGHGGELGYRGFAMTDLIKLMA